MSNNYWINRMRDVQKSITDINIESTEKQLAKYYQTAMRNTIDSFESTYNKLLTSVADGKQPTPADLYKLDSYYKMQSQLQHELQKLGDKSMITLQSRFIKEYESVYKSLSIEGMQAFSTADTASAKQIINSIWLNDGKSWSDRVWNNTTLLRDRLNDELINCISIGKKTSYLTKSLQREFGVSYSRASTLVRTELAHIETQSAVDRYKSYNLKQYEFYADTDCRTCDECAKLDGKIFLLNEMQAGVNAPPMHPNDRCCIIPIVK